MSIIKDIVFKNIRERNCIECTMLGGVILPLIKMEHYKTYLYGCGQNVYPIVNYILSNDVHIEAIIDQDKEKDGIEVVNGIKYIHNSKVDFEDSNNTFVIIVTRYFSGLEQKKITDYLYEKQIGKYYHVEQDDIREVVAGCFEGVTLYYRKYIDELEKNYFLLADDKSRRVMKEYIRAQVQEGRYNETICPGKNKYFMGNENEDIYKHLENEVWVNCGSNIGDSIFNYFSQGYGVKCIYAFEGDKVNYLKLSSNLQFLPQKYGEKVIAINEFISIETCFNSFISEPVTLINADIEGAELDLLKAMKEVIEEDRPVIAVCIYHKKEDFIQIPSYINSIVQDYKYVCRKYESGIMDYNNCFEVVLYAIPNERYTLNV